MQCDIALSAGLDLAVLSAEHWNVMSNTMIICERVG